MGCLPDLPSELHEPIARHLNDDKASQNAFSLVSLALLPQVHALGVWDTPNLYSSVAEILCRVAHPPPYSTAGGEGEWSWGPPVCLVVFREEHYRMGRINTSGTI